ncbi:hypothetical protein C8J56DRAFT_1065736 [Mycena floridula]|nr:hypothetical protein C8J56DRAFT_1065736 [Mycena floridula]
MSSKFSNVAQIITMWTQPHEQEFWTEMLKGYAAYDVINIATIKEMTTSYYQKSEIDALAGLELAMPDGVEKETRRKKLSEKFRQGLDAALSFIDFYVTEYIQAKRELGNAALRFAQSKLKFKEVTGHDYEEIEKFSQTSPPHEFAHLLSKEYSPREIGVIMGHGYYPIEDVADFMNQGYYSPEDLVDFKLGLQVGLESTSVGGGRENSGDNKDEDDKETLVSEPEASDGDNGDDDEANFDDRTEYAKEGWREMMLVSGGRALENYED